jgi:hypothetical protein
MTQSIIGPEISIMAFPKLLALQYRLEKTIFGLEFDMIKGYADRTLV